MNHMETSMQKENKRKSNQVEYLELNGARQCISIRADTSDLPLLLYLHGGPGDAALPLVSKYNKSLETYFTVVVWEQRGAGKSYYDFGSAQIGIETFVEDAVSLIRKLLKRFGQEKLYLAGHSWGSVLGLKIIQSYPDLVHTYIGCGQVVKYKGSLYGKKNYNSMIKDFVFSSDYNLKELINRQKGSYQAIKYLWPELMTVDFTAVTHYEVPVVFVEGRYDYHVSSELVKEYYDALQSPKQFYWFEQSCHFPQWSEAEKFTDVMKAVLK